MGYVKDVYAIINYIIEEYQMKPTENDQKYFHYVKHENRLLVLINVCHFHQDDDHTVAQFQ